MVEATGSVLKVVSAEAYSKHGADGHRPTGRSVCDRPRYHHRQTARPAPAPTGRCQLGSSGDRRYADYTGFVYDIGPPVQWCVARFGEDDACLLGVSAIPEYEGNGQHGGRDAAPRVR